MQTLITYSTNKFQLKFCINFFYFSLDSSKVFKYINIIIYKIDMFN